VRVRVHHNVADRQLVVQLLVVGGAEIGAAVGRIGAAEIAEVPRRRVQVLAAVGQPLCPLDAALVLLV
jgi:hypothetical protein